MLMGTLCGFKILKKKLFKSDFMPLYNGAISFEFKKYNWKWYMVLYSPLLLLIPVLFIFLHPIFIYYTLYLISTMMYYKKHFIWLCLPSKGDINYKNKIDYFTYIVSFSSEEEFNYYYKKNNLNKLIKKYKLLTETEYLFKKNKQ